MNIIRLALLSFLVTLYAIKCQNSYENCLNNENIKQNLLLSESVFIFKTKTILNNPIDDSELFLRGSIQSFIKGCNNNSINLHFKKNLINCLNNKKKDTQNINIKEMENYLLNNLILVFGCKRDSNGINWNIKSVASLEDNIIKQDYIISTKEEFIEFSRITVSDKFGCSDCCESLTQCFESFTELENWEDKQKMPKTDSNENGLQKIFSSFKLKKNFDVSGLLFER